MTPGLLRSTVDFVLDLVKSDVVIDTLSVEQYLARHRLIVSSVDLPPTPKATEDNVVRAYRRGGRDLRDALDAGFVRVMRDGAEPVEAIAWEDVESAFDSLFEGGD